MHTINSPYGQVQRIVIFKKNGVQAMVEYPFLWSLCDFTHCNVRVCLLQEPTVWSEERLLAIVFCDNDDNCMLWFSSLKDINRKKVVVVLDLSVNSIIFLGEAQQQILHFFFII